MNMKNSEKAYSESINITPGGVSSPVRAFKPHPVFMEKGKGCIITDIDGNEFVDMCMAYGPLIAGHACDRVMNAAKAQMDKGTVYGAPSQPELDMIKTLISKVPCAEMARLSNSGTEATMHAIRTARGFTGKNGIVKINGGFHGAHDAVLFKPGSGSVHGTPGSAGVPADAVKNTYSVEYNDANELENLLDNNDDIAGLIMEPVMGNAGVITPKKGYLEEVRKITKSHDVVLIFDEVITGFRLGPNSAQGLFGVTPDMTTMAKILGGGFAAGAFMGRKEIMEMVAPNGPIYAAGTFAGNPVSAAAGLEQIQLMSEDDNYGKINASTAKLVAALRDSMTDNNVKGCVQSIGSMFSLFFNTDKVENGSESINADHDIYNRLFRFMLDNGVYLPPSALEVDFVSLAHDEASMNKVGELFDTFLREDKA